jgi:SAM-dependent methyltransferase
MICTLCNTHLTNKVDRTYFICSTCGAYVKDQRFYLSPAKEKGRYEEHNNDVNDFRYQQFTAPITEYVLNNFNSSHVGLDYGSGTGPVISKQLIDRGFKINLYDPFFYPNTDYVKTKYDFIFSCEVFEHFYQPKQEIEHLLNLLKANGKLIVMTHVYDHSKPFKTWYYRNDPTHVFIYTEKTVRHVSEMFNLKIEKQTERMIVFAQRPTASTNDSNLDEG